MTETLALISNYENQLLGNIVLQSNVFTNKDE